MVLYAASVSGEVKPKVFDGEWQELGSRLLKAFKSKGDTESLAARFFFEFIF